LAIGILSVLFATKKIKISVSKWNKVYKQFGEYESLHVRTG
jgi:hypothetical protein